MRVFLIGFMGSGKTFWGKQLAKQIGLPFFDLDEEISRAEQKTISQLFASLGEEKFRVKEKDALEGLIDKNESMVLSCGGGTPCFFNNIERMKKYGVVVWLNTHVEILVQRLLKEKPSRPLLNRIDDADLKSYIIRKLNERKIYYEQADLIIDNENTITTSEFIQTILHA